MREPGRHGQDSITIDEVQVAENGREVFLKVKEMGPVMQYRIAYDLASARGKRMLGAIHGTIHRVPAKK